VERGVVCGVERFATRFRDREQELGSGRQPYDRANDGAWQGLRDGDHSIRKTQVVNGTKAFFDHINIFHNSCNACSES
jgi:hypothetical protein